MKVYLVTFDGYYSWGSDIYALGVYSSLALAEEAVEGLKKVLKRRHLDIGITEFEVDRTEKVVVEDVDYGQGSIVRTDSYLGGYEE